MEKVIKVKEKPLDSDSNCVDQQKRQDLQQETNLPLLSPTRIKIEEELDIKTEYEEQTIELNCEIKEEITQIEMDSLHVVDEQPNVITVNAFDFKSEDEKKFIKSMEGHKNLFHQRKCKKSTEFQQTCPKCFQIFHSHRVFVEHMDMGLCTIFVQQVEKCTVCPMAFATQTQLQDHLALHKLNRYFCGKHCGRSFSVIDECEIHEFEDHPARNIFCSICNHKFSTCKELRQHLQCHSLIRRFVCSFCRKWFSCSIDLAKHWQINKDSCGELMQDIVRDTNAAIESSLPVFNSNASVTEKRLTKKKSKADKRTSTTTSNLFATIEPAVKRKKLTANKETYEIFNNESSPIYFSLNDVKIKDEPQSDYENSDGLQSTVTNTTSTADFNSVIKTEKSTAELNSVIKTETIAAIETEIKIKQEPGLDVSDNSVSYKHSTITPTTMPKLVPRPYLLSLPSVNINSGNSTILPASATLPFLTKSVNNIAALPPTTNLRLVRLPNLQPAPTPLLRPTIVPTMPILKPLQLQNQNIKLPPISLKGFKIYKIMPNAKLMPLPAKSDSTIISPIPAATVVSPSKVESPIILKLKNPTELSTGNMAMAPLILNISQELTANAQKPSIADNGPPMKPAITLQLNSLATNTTIDAEDLKKLVNEAAVAAKCGNSATSSLKMKPVKQRRKQIESKSRFELNLIENLPQKRELIENIKQQIKSIESKSGIIDNLKQEIKASDSDHGPKTILPVAEYLEKVKNEQDVYDNDSDTNGSFDDLDDFDSKPLIIDENADSMDSNSDNEEFELSSNVSCLVGSESLQAPPTFLLPITSECDPELSKARKLYTEQYRYAWICPKCPRFYGQKHAFRGHLVSVHGYCKEEFNQLMIEVKPIPCTKSLEEITQKPCLKLEAEFVISSKEKIKSEEIMKSEMKSKRSLNVAKYRRSQHNKFTCSKCGRSCSTRTALNDHVAANCSREPQYPCTSCPKKFFSASTLNSHLSIHTGDLPHKCSFCDKRFRTRGQVTVHHRTHTGERPFSCQVCNQRFTHRETLISHLSRHIGMKRYKCYGCQQQFACISGLKTHREVRFDSCGKVKLNTRAIGPRVRVIKGNVIFEEQPEINPYLRTESPDEVSDEIN